MTTLPIVGARFRPPAEEVLKLLPSGTKLLLRRQPDNPYDENAVQVILQDWKINWAEIFQTVYGDEITKDERFAYEPDLHLGFIPREAAKEVAPLMDKKGEAQISDEGIVLTQWHGLLTFGLTGLPNVSFEEPIL